MRLKPRKPSGREKDQESIELLNRLRQLLHLDDISKARQAAHILSWMQEDGLDILTEGLFKDTKRKTKIASAYGLRKMQGRMRAKALDIFYRGRKHSNPLIRNVCEKALTHIKVCERTSVQKGSPPKDKIEIKEVPVRQGNRAKQVKRVSRHT